MKKLRNILCAVFALLLAVSFSACSKAAVDETTEDGAEADTQITVIAANGTTQTVAVPNGSDTPAQSGETKNSGAANPRRTETMLRSRRARPAARVSAKPCASR